MLKAYKFRLYPSQKQEEVIKQILGNVRFVYNHCLFLKNEKYKDGKQKFSYSDMSKHITDLKKYQEYAWLKIGDSIALQQSLRDLDRAFQRFFKKQANYPKFHSKRRKTSYRTINQKDSVRIENGKLRLPKLGLVRFSQSRFFDGKIKNATVSKTPSNKYFVSLLVEEEDVFGTSQANEVGIDIGIKDFAICSDGKKYNYDFEKVKRFDKKLKRLQRKFARTVKKSQNHEKMRVKVARQYERIHNIKIDFFQKLSTKLVNENQVIVIESLKIKNMLKNKKLSKSIHQVSWNEFLITLDYKAKWKTNCRIIKIGTFFPSSQLCSVCGYKNPEVKDLKIREWECPKCHAKHDRDVNASKNILTEGLRLLA